MDLQAGDAGQLFTDQTLDFAQLQRRLVDLADRRQRHRVDDMDRLGARGAFADLALGVGQQGLFVDRGTGLELHIGHRQLAGVRVGAAHRGGERDLRMPVQRLLDRGRIDVVPAADDQLLLAAGQPEVTVRVLAAEIAGIEPAPLVSAVDPELRVLGRIEVAGEDIGAGDRDRARFVDLGLALITARVVEDQHLHVLMGNPQADRADASFTLGRIDRTDASAFGQTIAFEDADAGGLLEAPEHFQRHRRGTAQAELQTRYVGLAQRYLQQPGIQRGHAAEEVDAIVLHDLPEVLDHALAAITLGRTEHNVRPFQKRQQAGHQSRVDVEQRQAAVDDLAESDTIVHDAAGGPGIRDLVAVGPGRDLGAAGGAASAEIRGDLVATNATLGIQPTPGFACQLGVKVVDFGGSYGPRRLFPQTQRLERELALEVQMFGQVHPQNVPKRANPRQEWQELVPQVRARHRQRRDGDQHLGLGRIEQLGNLRRFQQRIDSEGDAGGLPTPQDEVRFRKVRQQVGNDIAASHAKSAEQIGATRHLLEQLAIAVAAGTLVLLAFEKETQGRLAAEGFGAVAQQFVGRSRQGLVGEASGFGGAHVVETADGHGQRSLWRGFSNFKAQASKAPSVPTTAPTTTPDAMSRGSSSRTADRIRSP